MDSQDIRARLEVAYRFGEYLDLRGITCEDRLVLDGAVLTGCDFTGASFPQGISARGALFQGLSWFRQITAQDADFGGAIFHSDARFDGAALSGPLQMARAEFRGVLQFDSATLGGGVDLEEAVGYGNCSFENAQVTGTLNLRGSEWMGGLWLESARFDRLTAGDMLVHGRLWTRRAQLDGHRVQPDNFDISFGYVYA